MKTSTLFTLAAALALSLSVIGCKTSSRTTPLPMADGGRVGNDSSRKEKDLSTQPLNDGDKGKVAAVNDLPIGDLPDSDKLRDRDQDRSIFAAQTVYFEFDHANVRGNEASKIEQVAGQFKTKGPDFDLLIEGHCDERGTEEYNRSLGERRALAIRELLIKSGVDAGRVFTKSFGKDRPADTGHDGAAWSKNRRGEFVLVLPKKLTTTQNTQ